MKFIRIIVLDYLSVYNIINGYFYDTVYHIWGIGEFEAIK